MSVVNYKRDGMDECSCLKSCWSGAGRGRRYFLMVGRIKPSITFAVGQRSDIGRYFLPDLGIGMINDKFHIAGISQLVTERLKRAVIYSIALGPRFFKWKMLSLSVPNVLLFLQLLIALVTMSAVNVSAISIGFLWVSLVTNRVLLKEECLPSFEVLNFAASCLDDKKEIPLKVIASFSTAW